MKWYKTLRRLLRYLFVSLLTCSLASTDPVTTRRTFVIIQGGPYLQVAQRAQPKVCSVLWGYMYYASCRDGDLDKAKETFMFSCAGYCVATYVLVSLFCHMLHHLLISRVLETDTMTTLW